MLAESLQKNEELRRRDEEKKRQDKEMMPPPEVWFFKPKPKIKVSAKPADEPIIPKAGPVVRMQSLRLVA